MPELPDLQIYLINLKSRIGNKKITSTEVYNIFKVNTHEDSVRLQLLETKIIDIVRYGKELFFKLENNNVFSVHLMLNGRFDICNVDEIPKIKSKILSIGFEDGQALVVSDYKELCKVTFNPVISKVPDALGENFTLKYFIDKAKKNSRVNIKGFLIDQKIVKGIGNAYVDEILWKANISPASLAGKIPEERLRDLHDAIICVLEDAIVNIEKIAPDIINGEERSFLKVHNPNKEYTDEGDKIIVKKIASKITYYTEKQELF